MATTIQLLNNRLYLTSEFPDVRISTSLDCINVEISSDDLVVFQATYYPYEGRLTLYNLSTILKHFLSDREIPYAHFTLEAFGATKSDAYAAVEFDALLCEISLLGYHTINFLSESFLTLPTYKRVDVKTSDTLYFFAKADEEINQQLMFTCLDHAGKQHLVTSIINRPQPSQDGILSVMLNFTELFAPFSQGFEKPLALTVKVNRRYFTYFFIDEPPTYTFHFRNCFGLWEKTSFRAVTTVKLKVDRSIAVSNNRSSFYDQTIEKSYETETAPLPCAEAEWLQSFLFSIQTKIQFPGQPDVFDDLSDILVTESSGDATDDDNELCKVKFAWRFASQYPHVYIPNPDRIHTDTFLETFN